MKTSELTGAALDWAVAKSCMDETVNVYFTEDGHKRHRNDMDFTEFSPSTDWAQGGPIIDRERISLYGRPGDWVAEHHEAPAAVPETGPTPLVAAMRCFVASRLGEEVDIPAELKD